MDAETFDPFPPSIPANAARRWADDTKQAPT
jgi:hypothetical protein